MTEAQLEESPATGRFAAIGAMAAERSRLERRVLLLSEVIGAFAEATTEYDQLLGVIAQKLAEISGDLCTVLLVSDDGRMLSAQATYDPDPGVRALAHAQFGTEPFPILPVHQKVLDTGEPYFQPRVHYENVREITTASRAAFTEQLGVHSSFLVALRAHGRAIGLLALLRHRPDQPPYDEADRDLAQLLANHAAIAIANARVLQRRDREIVLAMEQAERANRELEAFSYSVAHDLRAPLRAIDRFTHALRSDYAAKLGDDGRHCLERVQWSAQRMTHLIDDLLTLSRVSHHPLHREPVDVTDIARKILVDPTARSPERAVELRIGDGLRARADRGLLQVVLENLLGNAWKFTARQATAIIEVGHRIDDGHTVFFVRDNGTGFDMKLADKLFRPFQRLHNSSEFEGSGIGLATVHRIVGRHGGRVWVESAPGRGTTVFFTVTEQA
jgi:signal transduction histidine kinase